MEIRIKDPGLYSTRCLSAPILSAGHPVQIKQCKSENNVQWQVLQYQDSVAAESIPQEFMYKISSLGTSDGALCIDFVNKTFQM